MVAPAATVVCAVGAMSPVGASGDVDVCVAAAESPPTIVLTESTRAAASGALASDCLRLCRRATSSGAREPSAAATSAFLRSASANWRMCLGVLNATESESVCRRSSLVFHNRASFTWSISSTCFRTPDSPPSCFFFFTVFEMTHSGASAKKRAYSCSVLT